MHRISGISAVLFVLGLGVVGFAEEGMYLPNQPPREILKKKYGFEPTPQWLELMQRAAVRFPNGSGSFVSSEGLVFTNHHIGVDCAQKLSSAKENLVENGFYARTRIQERPCPDLELRSLESITDVSDAVAAATASAASPKEAELARRGFINTLETQESKKTGLRCEVVNFWNGARQHLYCYKLYTDVRLVFIPEVDIARFGGDPDNFEFPRFDLDVSFFRVYEHDAPVKPRAYFPWRTDVLQDGELVFTSGHPGRTDRADTTATLQSQRDMIYPTTLHILRRFEIALQQFSTEGREEARIADDELFGIQNSRKAYVGLMEKLQDPEFFRAKHEAARAMEKHLEAADEELLRGWREAEEAIANAERDLASPYAEWLILERGWGFYSNIFSIARTIVRLGTERQKPNAERLGEYTDANIPARERAVLSPVPLYGSLEAATLGESLELLVETFGADNDLVQKILNGLSPRERARKLITQTKLTDIAFRKKLLQEGQAIRESTLAYAEDPMIQLAMLVDERSRYSRSRIEPIRARIRSGYAKLYEVTRKSGQFSAYPDATFTLRLSFGTVKGYEENGTAIPWFTTFAGLYARSQEHENLRPWKLPPRWEKRMKYLRLATPFNFVSTNDITGGNSGSPVLDRQGQVVGIIFDSNIQGLGNDVEYSETQARAVSVTSVAVIEALRKIYDANTLANELGK